MVRVNVDPAGVLTSERLREGMAALRGFIADIGAEMVDNDLEARPAGRRELELLIACDEVEAAKRKAISLCAKAFNSAPMAGVVTFISRGTDDDA
ncbi:hypothetical protein PJH54_29915, partial [Mycobacterium kansasii]